MRWLLIGWVLLSAGPAFSASASLTGAWVPFASADGTPIRGWLEIPAGDGPRPGVVMLHGCGGPVTKSGKIASREKAWIGLLTAQGYAVLLADSFTPRGYGSICALKDRPVRSNRERPNDASGARAFLAAQPGVDPARIALMGWSQGAMTTLWTVRAGGPVQTVPDFRAAVAFYPGCVEISRAVPDWRPRMPMLLQMGAADDWTLPGSCRKLADAALARGAAIEADFYDGAYHGFDSPSSAVRTRPIPFSSGIRDVHVGTNAEARGEAIRRTLDWLAGQLR